MAIPMIYWIVPAEQNWRRTSVGSLKQNRSWSATDYWEETAIATQQEVGARVRQTIREIGGTMPELLPSEPSIKKLASQHRKQQKQITKAGLKADSSSE